MARSPLILRKFDPFQMPVDVVRRLAVGRNDVLKTLVSAADDNLKAIGPPQHFCLVAPRGSGKTFLLRLLGIALAERTAGGQILFLHLPEELPHVQSPLAFLREIRRRLLGEGPTANAPRKREDVGTWDALCDEIDQILASRFGDRQGLLVLCAENIKDVLRAAFRDETARRKLRAWLERSEGRVMLIAASSAGRFDRDADKALFAIVHNIELVPWTPAETIEFLNRVMIARDGRKLTQDDERVARAIAVFSGGNPRLVTAMAEVLGAEDVMSAAQMLDALIDNLQEYYLNRLRDLTDEENRSVASLLTDGENVSQTEVARRLGVQQSAVAQTFRKLEYDDAFLISERLPGQRERLYRIADRVFVHFYNVRVLYHGTERSVLSPILDFLVSAFSEIQRADQAERLMARGLPREAGLLFGTLSPLTPAMIDYKWWTGNREIVQAVADMLEERWPDAVAVISAVRALVHDPNASPSPDRTAVVPEFADLLSALDHFAKGRWHAARRKLADIHSKDVQPWLRGVAWICKAYAAYFVDDRAEMGFSAHEAEVIARKINDPRLLAWALHMIIQLDVISGDLDAAERGLQEIANSDFQERYLFIRSYAYRRLAALALQRDDLPGAESLSQRALDLAEATSRTNSILSAQIGRARVLISAGRPDEALALAEAAAELAREARDFDDLWTAFDLQADALRALYRNQEAIERSGQCLKSLPDNAGPYLRAGPEASHAWALVAPSTPPSDFSDAEADGLADCVLIRLDDVAQFAHWRSLALEAKLSIAKRAGRDHRTTLEIARRLATTSQIAGRSEIAAWALAEAVDALWRLKRYDEAEGEAVAALKALTHLKGDVESNRNFVASRLVSILRGQGRLGDVRRIVADVDASMQQSEATTLADGFLPLALEAQDYELGVDLAMAKFRSANTIVSVEPALKSADVALACIAGTMAWTRASSMLTEDFWVAAAKQHAGWGVARVIAESEKTKGRAAAYAIFRAAWDQRQSDGRVLALTIEVLRQLLTNWRAKSFSAGLLGDIVGTIEMDGSGEFDYEARMLRELTGFKAADSSTEALARLDPDLAAALVAADPNLVKLSHEQGKNRKRAKARKPSSSRRQRLQ